MPQHNQLRNVKIITKEGECNISLTLDINVNINNGAVSVVPTVTAVQKEEEETTWAIPQFSSQTNKIKFGKKE